MNNIWNPKEDKCTLLQTNNWVFVEEIDRASDEKTDLLYGRIISTSSIDWINGICERGDVILFKETSLKFEFTSHLKNDWVNICYAIKPEDIIGLFQKEEK